MIRTAAFILAIFLAVPALAASAQAAPACVIPKDLAPAAPYTPAADEIAKVPTAFHLLAVAWAPEWRRTEGTIKATAQRLDPQADRGFFLHGLWPNGTGKPYPRYCAPVGGIELPTVRKMYCRTPSAELLQHEWQAHGACGWTEPAVYFRQAARLYDRLRLPQIERAGKSLTAGDIRRAFIARNRWLTPQMITVADRDGRFSEVRLCYDARFRPTACPEGVGLADGAPLQLTPSRGRGF